MKQQIKQNYANLRRKGFLASRTKRVAWKTPSRYIA